MRKYAILVALFALLVIVTGATLTSNIRPLPGPNPGPVASAPGLQQIHVILGVLLAVLTIGIAARLRNTFGYLALAAVIAESALGNTAPTLHAILAPIVFSILVGVAVVASESWSRPPAPTPDLWPPLLNMSVLAPIMVLIQISLGAAFRHNAIGVVWHILDAGLVLLLVMVLGVCVLRQFPEHPSLRPAAIWMLVITGIQVLLGFSVYLILLIVEKNNMALIVSGILHVVTGSLTLATTVVMALEIRRCARSQTGQ